MRRQQSMQMERVTLGIGERGAFVEHRLVDQIEAGQVRFDRRTGIG